jgi:hypothetical protein
MPCTTPECPAPMASAPRGMHAEHCDYAGSRSGKSGGQPKIRVRPDLADELRRIKALGLEDEAVEALRNMPKKELDHEQ